MDREISNFSFPTRILFGAGALSELSAEIGRLGVKRPLLVTDKGIVESSLADRAIAAAKPSTVVIYDGVSPNPTEENVFDGLARYRGERCDAIIGLGGGSSIDAAKAIRLGATHPPPLEQYDDQLNGAEKIGPNLPPMIAIATTSGTGSEVGRSTVIILKSTDRKTVIFSPYLIPNSAIADPELTMGLPMKLTAGTGLDALAHNIEAYLSKGYHPMCDAIALEGVRLCIRHLPAAVRNGKNLEARTGMMASSMMGAVAFQKGLGAVHSLSHPLSSVAGLHHGTTNGILLAHVMEFNRSTCEERLRDLALAMNLKIWDSPVPEAASAAIQRVQGLLTEIGSPYRLSTLGISREMIPMLAKKAMEDACHRLNPRPCSEADMVELYMRAL